eukprot:Pompholyxophrys_punicea_v1_NODE_53_length_4254_cov_18.877590.p1 type:complete len:841 gc:universal NODE_53_length_4254_cov_18.877590:1608-4130(+)
MAISTYHFSLLDDDIFERFIVKFKLKMQGINGLRVITKNEMSFSEAFGFYDTVRLQINNSDGSFKFVVFSTVLRSGIIQNVDELESLMDLFDDKFTSCVGIQDYVQLYEQAIRVDHVNLVRAPSQHGTIFRHQECLLWFFQERFSSKYLSVCPNCITLSQDLQKRLKKHQELTPEENLELRRKRASPSSNYPVRELSPDHLRERYDNLMKERFRDRRKLKRFACLDIVLDKDQDDDMTDVVKTIESDPEMKKILETIFKEADSDGNFTGRGQSLRAIWSRDVNMARGIATPEDKDIWESDQERNSVSKSGKTWSSLTYRLCLSVFTRSTAAYEALKSFGVFNLPSVKTLQNIVSQNYHAPGVSHEFFAKQWKLYENKKQRCRENSVLVPQGFGVWIMDECKVVQNLHWNSKNNRLYGYSMTKDDMISLHDIYKVMDSQNDIPASYILQTIWRDCTSDFDFVGPYFSSPNGFDHKFLMSCFLETAKMGEIYGFRVGLVIVDGASENLAMIKTFVGHYDVESRSKAFKQQHAKLDDIHSVPCSMLNPFRSDNSQIYFMICPSHELKNCVAALYSSRNEGAKKFCKKGVQFGWKTMENLCHRQYQQAASNQMMDVHNLKAEHVYRDSWTRLNVVPAKIVQQADVISALRGYTKSSPKPVDSENVETFCEMLEALRDIFEDCLLTSVPLLSLQDARITNMQRGYSFFVSWANERLSLHPEISNKENINFGKQTGFLHWQTWDELRITYYAFLGFCTQFFSLYPKYFISPVRLNGSAVETIFGQLKNLKGSSSKLSAAVYGFSLAMRDTKVYVAGDHTNDAYHNADIKTEQQDIYRTPRKKICSE